MIEEEICVNDSINHNSGRWNPEEYKQFVEYYQIHGKDWKAIAKCIGTRTPEQVRSHAQKYFAKIYRKAMEEKEVLEAAELIPDWTDKRLTRKKKKKVNYKEKDIILEECIGEGIRKKLCRKEKEKEQTQEIKQEQILNPVQTIGLQTEPLETISSQSPPTSLPFFFHFISPYLMGNSPIWIPS